MGQIIIPYPNTTISVEELTDDHIILVRNPNKTIIGVIAFNSDNGTYHINEGTGINTSCTDYSSIKELIQDNTHFDFEKL